MIHPITLAINATFTACLVPEGGMKNQRSTTTFSNNKSHPPLNANTATWKIPVAVFFFDKNSRSHVKTFSVNFYKKHMQNNTKSTLENI